MNEQTTVEKPDYGNWVSKRLLCGSGLVGILFLGLSFLFPILAIGAAFFLLSFAYFLYARHQFSSRGRDIQAQIYDLVLDHLDWDGQGRALDIGCGNAPLTIKLAKQHPHAQIIGIDFWGAEWDYTKEACETNAEIARVADRVAFQKASAADLPFDDGSFNAAVSNFVFHEVRDAKDKRDVLKEALRVVKRGGKFAFQDLFLVKRLYGEIDDLLEEIKRWGIQDVEFVNTSDASFIPPALKLPFMVGSVGIIRGTK